MNNQNKFKIGDLFISNLFGFGDLILLLDNQSLDKKILKLDLINLTYRMVYSNLITAHKINV